jgi:hypothetical protein
MLTFVTFIQFSSSRCCSEGMHNCSDPLLYPVRCLESDDRSFASANVLEVDFFVFAGAIEVDFADV